MFLQVGADAVSLPTDHGELPTVCDRTIKGDMIHPFAPGSPQLPPPKFLLPAAGSRVKMAHGL
jgi:hypothetical protein